MTLSAKEKNLETVHLRAIENHPPYISFDIKTATECPFELLRSMLAS